MKITQNEITNLVIASLKQKIKCIEDNRLKIKEKYINNTNLEHYILETTKYIKEIE